MTYKVKILADSIAQDVRLTTVEATFPRIILAELNTHRMLSRNSASSRAIPVEKRIKAVRANPFVPAAFGANKKGMQAGEPVRGWRARLARWAWLTAAYMACFFAWMFSKLGVHKQWANRLLEPFSWHTAIISATEWENFFNLRCHPDAQPEIRTIAEMIRDARRASTPKELKAGEWHLPLIFEEDIEAVKSGWPGEEWLYLAKISSGRCARVSYLTHDGKRDLDADRQLADRLQAAGHMSPFEHVACVLDMSPPRGIAHAVVTDFGNFEAPWHQFRKLIPGEHIYRPPT